MPQNDDGRISEHLAALKVEVHALDHNMGRQLSRLEKRIDELSKKIDEDYLTRREHRPVAAAVYGFFAIIGATFLGLVWKLLQK